MAIDNPRGKGRRARVVDVEQDATQDQAGTEPLTFVANLCDRQSALMLSGSGDRCLVELEAFGVNAALALVGMARFTQRGFKVTIEELPESYTKLYDETNKSSEGQVTRVGRRRVADG